MDAGHTPCESPHGAKKEAKAISSLIGSLGADIKASVPLNEGLCLSVEDKGWKLQRQSEVEALCRKLDEEKPTLMVGLPPDGPFAGVQRSYNSLLKVTKEKEKEVLEAGRKQVRTCVEAFRYQLGQNKYYLQECPNGAKAVPMGRDWYSLTPGDQDSKICPRK